MRSLKAKRLSAAALVMALLGSGAGVASAAPATKAFTIVGGTGACTSAKGALVAVDFAHWSGPIVRGCDPKPTTGSKLLTTGGFTTAGTQQDGPTFICRIGHPLFAEGAQYPTKAQDPCVRTPPPTAYWSYWRALKGKNTWTHSTLGAYADKPTTGEVEAWTFGVQDIAAGSGLPTFSPNQIRSQAAANTSARASRSAALIITPVDPASRVSGRDDQRATTIAPGIAPQAGAAYLVKQLVAGTHLEFGGGYGPDFGGTADIAFALAASNQNDATLINVVRYLSENVADYADPAGTGQYPGPYSGAAGKLAVLAEVTGQNPDSFGGFDLLQTLTGHVCAAADAAGACTATGDFYQAYSTVSQALDVLALARGGVTPPAAALARLKQLQCPDGGFSSTLIAPGASCTSDVDTTGYALQALALVPSATRSVAAADTFLRGAQDRDGGWTGAAGENTNSAALAIQGLLAAPATTPSDPAVELAMRFLGGLQNRDGGFGISASSPGSDERATAQAVPAALFATLPTLTDRISLAPQVGGSGSASGTASPSAPGSSSPLTRTGSAPGGSSASAAVSAGGTADTGVPSGQLLGYALVVLALGLALSGAGRRRILPPGRHRGVR